jgi:hypothetical protein
MSYNLEFEERIKEKMNMSFFFILGVANKKKCIKRTFSVNFCYLRVNLKNYKVQDAKSRLFFFFKEYLFIHFGFLHGPKSKV